MTTIIGIILLICIALCGWSVAELKARHDVYEHSESELAVEDAVKKSLEANGYHELSIQDVIKTISTKGFNA